MTSNYYTLLALVNELRPQLVGSRFIEAYSFRPNELRIVLGSLQAGSGTLVAVLKPINGGLFLSTREESRPKSNVQKFFEGLKDAELTEMRMAENDRALTLQFGSTDLILNFFGTPNALLNRAGNIASSFKKVSVREKSLSNDPYSMLGKRYLRELSTEPADSDKAALDARLRSAQSAIVYRSDEDILLSLIPLQIGVEAMSVEHLDSVNTAVRKTIVERTKLQRFGSVRKSVLDQLRLDLHKLLRAQREMTRGAENSDKAERYTTIANSLLMVAHEVPAGVAMWRLEIEGEVAEIKLDEKLNAYENAGKYFERSKQAVASREELKRRTIETAAKVKALELRIASLESESELDVLLDAQKLFKKSSESKATIDGSFFREFVVAGGFRVLVGKNAKQNDELTLHVAKKDDVWLHARGVPGSHVVLQTGKRTQIPKEAIEQAAEIAAYYSDARPQGIAPVAYTEKKYVRKPRGAAPGAVKLEREEVVMVKPQIRGKIV